MLAGQTDSCYITLSGIVIDEHDNEPLPFATFVIQQTERAGITDENGRFYIENLCAGTYIIEVGHIACEPLVQKIVLNESKELKLLLEHHTELLEQITVETEKIKREHTQATVKLNKEELSRLSGKPLAQVIENMAGISVIKSGPGISKPVIHGLSGNRILVFNNQIRLENQQWGAEHAPAVDPFVSSEIEVVKGASAVRYGADAIAGVILMNSPKLSSDSKLTGAFHWVGQSNGWGNTVSAQLEKGLKKIPGLAWRLQGTYKRIGDRKAPDYYLSNTGIQEANASAALAYTKWKYGFDVFVSRFNTAIGILRASHIGNISDLEKAINATEPGYIDKFSYAIEVPKQKVRHHLLKAAVYRRINNLGRLNLVYGSQWNRRKEFDVRRGGRSDTPALDLSLQTHTVNLNLEQQAIKHWRGGFGISAFYQENENVGSTGYRPLIPNYSSFGYGIYAIERLVFEKGELEAGIRYDYQFFSAKKFDLNNQLINPQLNYNNFSAALGAIVKPLKGLQFRANAGMAFRPPNAAELFSEGVRQTAAAIEIGDINLKVERGIKWVNTLSYIVTNRLQVNLTAYLHYIANYIYLQPDNQAQLTIRGAFPVFKYLQTNARLWGLDGSLDINIYKGLKFSSKVTMIRAKNLVSDEYIIFMPADRFSQKLSYNWTEVKSFEKVFVEIGFTSVLQQNRVPNGVDFSPPPAAFNLLNAAIGFTLDIKETQKLRFELSAENILNTAYRSYLNRLRYFADESGRNFTIRLNYEF